MLVAGIMASWFWSIGWEYLHDPSVGLLLGSPTEIAVRLALGIIAAALTFVPVYKEIAQAGGEMWVSYLVAFQNGFSLPPPPTASGVLREEAALDAVELRTQGVSSGWFNRSRIRGHPLKSSPSSPVLRNRNRRCHPARA